MPVPSSALGFVLATVIAPADAAHGVAAPIDFVRDVQPILQARCAECHAYGRSKGDFSLETRAGMLALDGAVVPGHADRSLLVALVRGEDPDIVMPPRGAPLEPEQIATLVRWIDEGAAWPEGVALRAGWIAPIRPRRPEIPPGDAAYPIDRFVAAHAEAKGVRLAPFVDDRAFARRASFDLVGLPPARDALDAFLADDAPGRHERFVRTLLADRVAYAEHWLSFWNDLLRNDDQGTGYIDGGRTQITAWLLGALESNLPYDAFVAALVNPAPDAAGFANGIVWRGEFNTAQSPPLQFAQNVAQVFLGENMKCASCHDSFVDAWTLDDAYGLAAIWSDAPLELHRCDVPTGRAAAAHFLFREIGDVDPAAPRAERLAQFAALMTSPDNGRLARTLVNRLWARLMGRGLVEPVDVMAGEPWSADLLDWLAADFADHRFDVQRLLEGIATSEAYRRRTVAAPVGDAYAFRGPAPRRLAAEQMLDAIWATTGTAPTARVAPPTPGGTEGAFVRAAVVSCDPLMRSLGRPNRDQVVTTRPRELTMLQALDLTNGAAYADLVRCAGAHLARADADPIESIYLGLLSRPPTDAERAIAVEILAAAPGADGCADLLWTVTMLPEFQLLP